MPAFQDGDNNHEITNGIPFFQDGDIKYETIIMKIKNNGMPLDQDGEKQDGEIDTKLPEKSDKHNQLQF